MKLILTAEVPNLGHAGDVVEVRAGYGRNYLLPAGYAILATRGALKQVEVIARARENRRIRNLEHAKEVKVTLESLGNVPIKAKVAAGPGAKKLFGSITAVDATKAIRDAGGPLLDKRTLEFGTHIKKLGTYRVYVHLHPDVTATVLLEVLAAN
jgi:large subunit ribosomal protein L9